MPTDIAITNEGADWLFKKAIDANTTEMTHMAIGAGDGTPADADYAVSQLNEHEARVVATRTNPAARQLKWVASWVMTAIRDLGAFAVVDDPDIGDGVPFEVMTFDTIQDFPAGATFSAELIATAVV